MANAKLGNKAIGSIVKLTVNGAPKELIVVHQGKPSSLYDESCNGTWLLMKDIYEYQVWQSGNINRYESSGIHTSLNSAFLNLFDSNIKDAIKQIKIPYCKNGGSGGTNQSGANGLPCKVFLLSGYEVGWTSGDNQYSPQDGAKLDYFTASSGGNSKRIANFNGSAALWWLRSPFTGYTRHVWYVNSNGNCEYGRASYSFGIRPALVLPTDMEVDSFDNVTPPAPVANKALVNGTTYEMKSGKTLVNGTVYNILKGRTLINGTGYNITLPGAGTKVSTLEIGQSVYAKVNGVTKEFIIVHQGKPSNIYDDSCNGTWLLMKDIYESRQWHSSNVNYLEYSTIHAYLNSTFLNLFDSNIKDAIKQVKIPYRKNSGSGGADQSGANGLSAKIFLLSGYEVGWTTSDNGSFPVDGAKLSYFEAGTGTSANNKRVANLNGSVFFWWLRSPYASGNVWRVSPNGLYDSSNASYSNGIRPALVLRSDAIVDDKFNIIS